MIRRALVLVALVLVATAIPVVDASAQRRGNAATALLGAGLGAYSGAGLGLVASLIPCDRVVDGRACARSVTAFGAVAGLGAGALLGASDVDELRRRGRVAGYGLAIGAGVGLVLRTLVRQYDWPDVGASAALGAAFGASAEGSAIGLGVGVLSGLVLWRGLGVADPSDAAALVAAGTALGGLLGWALDARDATDGGGSPLVIPLTIRIPW